MEPETAAPAGKGREATLSVILLMPRTASDLRLTIRSLQQQTVAEQLELVIVGESEDELRRARNLALTLPAAASYRNFADVRAVKFSRLGSLAAARAAGAMQSKGRVIVFAEDHCFPESGWAEAILKAHQGDCHLVGPLMKCANPATALSWVCLALHFGNAALPDSRGPAEAVPSHNTAFKREVLFHTEVLGMAPARTSPDGPTAVAEDDARLAAVESAMEMEYLFQQRLERFGFRAWQEPTAVTRHVNISRLGPALKHAVAGGWLYGAKRANQNGWGVSRRALQILLTPLVIAVQVKRKLPVLRQLPQSQVPFWKLLGLATLLIALHTLGEIRGLIQGLGDAVIRYSDFEHSRDRFLAAGDQAVLRGDPATEEAA